MLYSEYKTDRVKGERKLGDVLNYLDLLHLHGANLIKGQLLQNMQQLLRMERRIRLNRNSERIPRSLLQGSSINLLNAMDKWK